MRPDQLILNGILFVALLIVSALISGAETAYFRIQSRLKTYGEDESISAEITALLNRPRRLLIALLTGNTLVNVAMAFWAALITADIARSLNLSLTLLLAIESIVVTGIVLLFGEVVPKLLAIRHTQIFARMALGPVKIVIFILYPLGSLIYRLTHLLTRMVRLKPERMFASEEELKNLAEVGRDRGSLARSETEIIHSIFDFSDTAVHEVMTPRVDIAGLEASLTIEDALELVRTRQVSKIPVYRDTIDDVRGILYAKDILPFIEGPHPEVNLVRLARPPYFVPESKQVLPLLQEFKERRTSIAIVVDEYGGTAGLVTLEDIVEEVLGELRDPYDLEETEIHTVGSGEFVVAASITLDDLGEQLGEQFPEDLEYDTLGGLLFDQFDEIPSAGQAMRYHNRLYTVQSLDGNRISKVHISAAGTADESTDPD